MNKPIKKAVFPVGGLGTRFLPATKSMPKEMLPVASKPLIQHAFEEAVAAGIEEFIFVTGRNKGAITNHFDHSYELQHNLSEKDKKEALAQTRDWMPEAGQIAFVRQQEPLGLGHAVWCARNFIGDEPFAVLLADEIFLNREKALASMVDWYNQKGESVIGVDEVPNEKTNHYGIIAPKSDPKEGIIEVGAMVEKPDPAEAPSNYAIVGRYILTPDIFTHLENTPKGRGNEIQLTDAMQAMLENDPYWAVQLQSRRFDCGYELGFLEANIAFALEKDEDGAVKEMVKGYSV